MDEYQGLIYAIDPLHLRRAANRLQRVTALPLEQFEGAIEAATKSKTTFPIEGGTAIIRVQGVMEKYAFWSDEVSTIRVVRQIKEAVSNADVASIMLVVDSPGGNVDGIVELADAVFSARKAKPVIAQVDSQASSAAYWMASQADKIYVGGPLDSVGSIGVRMILYDTSQMYENEGIKPVVLDTGEHKSTGAPGAPITDEQRAELQSKIDYVFGIFKSAIMRGRQGSGLRREQLDGYADGRTFFAQDALDKKLVDGVQSFEGTLGALSKIRSDKKKRLEDESRRLSIQEILSQS